MYEDDCYDEVEQAEPLDPVLAKQLEPLCTSVSWLLLRVHDLEIKALKASKVASSGKPRIPCDMQQALIKELATLTLSAKFQFLTKWERTNLIAEVFDRHLSY